MGGVGRPRAHHRARNQFRGDKDPRAVPLTHRRHGHVDMKDHPITSPNQIAAAVGLQRTNLSMLMRGLERRGLIERTMSEGDRRGITVRLTLGWKHKLSGRPARIGRCLANVVENDARGLDRALKFLKDIAAGLIAMRPEKPVRNMSRGSVKGVEANGMKALKRLGTLVRIDDRTSSRCGNTNQQPIQFRKRPAATNEYLGPSCIPATRIRNMTASGCSSLHGHI